MEPSHRDDATDSDDEAECRVCRGEAVRAMGERMGHELCTDWLTD
jgi:hypothetical protein